MVGFRTAALVTEEGNKGVEKAVPADLLPASPPEQAQYVSLGDVPCVVRDRHEVEVCGIDAVAVGVVNRTIHKEEA